MGLKLNLGCGQDVRINYINIDKIKTHDAVVVQDFRNLSNISEGSIEDIVANHVLQFIEIEQIGNVMNQWCSKLQKGGSIYFESPDATMIGTVMSYNNASIADINKIFYSKQPDVPVGIYNLSTIQQILKQMGMEITEKGYNGTNFYIRATRP